MSVLDDLHAAVLADLDADAPRLVLADELQRLGDPRGELIVVQCELSRLGCERTRLASGKTSRAWQQPDWLADVFATGDPARHFELREIERKLLHAHAAQWTAGSPKNSRIERGFVSHVDGYHGNPVSIFDRAPTLESLELEVITSGVELIAESRLQQLRQLRLSLAGQGSDRPAIMRRLGELDRLRELAISGMASERVPPALLERLEGLDVSLAKGTSFEPMLESTPRLRHLRLSGGVARNLATPALEILELIHTGADHSKLELPNLRALRLADPGYSQKKLRSIGRGLPGLQLLDISETPLSRFAGAVLTGLPALTHLSLRRCYIEDAALEAFVKTFPLGQLRHLDLRENRLTDGCVYALAGATELRVLDVRGTPLTHRGIKTLRKQLPRTLLRGPVPDPRWQ